MAVSLGFGKNKQKSAGTTAQTSTQSLDPRLSGVLYDNVDRNIALASQPTRAYEGTLSGGLGASMGSARDAAMAMSGFTAPEIAAFTFDPTTGKRTVAGPAAVINRGDIRDITTSGATPEMLKAYQDPYQQQVIDAFMADNERGRQIQLMHDGAKAGAGKAFGGSRHGVLESLTNEDSARSRDSTTAGLRSQGFNTALAAVQSDLQRKFGADSANQGQDAAVASQNAQFLQQTNLTQAQMDAALEAMNAGIINGAGQFNASQKQSAAATNAQSALAAAGLRLNAAGVLERIGTAETAVDQAAKDREYQEWLRQQQDPYLKAQLLNSSIGMLPNYGTTVGTGSTTGKSTGMNMNARYTYGA